MKPYQKKKLLRQQIKKFLSKKNEILKTVGPVDKKLYKLQNKLAAIETPYRTISQVDHAGGTYEVIDYGEISEEECPLFL